MAVAARHNADLGMTNMSKTLYFRTPERDEVDEFLQRKISSIAEPQMDLLF